MRLSTTIAILFMGLVVGVVFVVSCGDDKSPAAVDAAVQCDCPSSEPPLTGRIVRVATDQSVPSMLFSGPVVFCERPAIVLSGGCFARSSDPKYILNSSFPVPAGDANPIGWACNFYNGTAAAVTSTAYVTCLKPAP
jgi:hypothetical protein